MTDRGARKEMMRVSRLISVSFRKETNNIHGRTDESHWMGRKASTV